MLEEMKLKEAQKIKKSVNQRKMNQTSEKYYLKKLTREVIKAW